MTTIEEKNYYVKLHELEKEKSFFRVGDKIRAIMNYSATADAQNAEL